MLPVTRRPLWGYLAMGGLILLMLFPMVYRVLRKSTTPLRPVPELIQQMKNPDAQERRKAIMDLGKHGADAIAAQADLVEALKDENSAVRAVSAEALGKLASHVVVEPEPLIPLLQDPDRYARRNAINALGKIGPHAKNAIPALVELVKTERTDATIAIRALERMGPDADAALLEITKGKINSDRVIREEASEALQRLRGQKPALKQ